MEKCLGALLPSLFMVRMQCPSEARAAEHLITSLIAQAAPLCGNQTLDAEMERSFQQGGVFFELAACATRDMSFDQVYLSYLAWAPFRAMVCSPTTTAGGRLSDAHASVGGRTAYAAIVIASLVALSFASTRVNALSKARHATLLACWAAVAIACVPALLWLPRPDMDVDGFYYHDDLTSCAFEFQRTLPEANLRNRVTSLVAPLASLKVMYDDVRELQVRNASLRTLCGHCSLYAFTLHGAHGLNEHLVLGRRPPVGDSELGLVNVLLPANVPREWAREWTEEVGRVVGARAGASFTNIHQAERDLVASIGSNGRLYAASMAATLVALCAAMRTYARDARAACGLAVLVLFVVAGSIGIGEAVCTLFSLPTTPYNAVIAPIVLGTGVDASLILMNAFRATSSLAIAWPSIVASQATTLLSFAIGTLLPVPHIRWFFVHSMVTMATSFLVQVAFFSYAAKHASYGKLGDATSQGAPPPRLWQWSVLAIALLWAAAGAAWRPPRVEFNMQNQISSAMQTYRFLASTATANRSQVVPMYAFVRSVDANWTDVYRRMSRLDATPVLDWHADFVESRAPNLSAWRERPSTQLVFETLVSDAGPSAVYANLRLDVDMEWGFGSQGGYTDALQRLEDLRTPDVCFASFDLMDGHTLSRVVAAVWTLALASCGLCTLLALSIARHHGLACFAALLMSYALALACLSAMRIKVHMMLVAAFLVAPGLLTDYIMHMTFNADTRTAVAWSAFTSMVSIAPYAASSSRGLRDFAIAYAVLVIAGALHAFAITCTRSAEYFLLRKGSRQGEGGGDA